MIYLSNYTDWPMGGMLSYVRNILPELCKKSNWEIDIWGAVKQGEKQTEFTINDEVYELKTYTTFRTEKKIVPNFIRSFFGVIKNRKQFYNYDVIYSHTSATTIAMKLLFPHKCIIHHQHGLSYKKNKGIVKILNIGYTIAQILADATFFVANEREVIKHKESKNIFRKKHFYYIGSPIDYTVIHKQNKNVKKNDVARNYIYTGRIDAWKNIDLLVDSFAIYVKKYNNLAKLTIVGDGPQYEDTVKKIYEMKFQDKILLVGRKNHKELVEYLNNSDVFLFPTKGEGVSLSLLEAFAAGLPAVTFDVIGVNDFVINGKTGIIVNKMTSKDYAYGIYQIQSIYKQMIMECDMIASEYDITKITSKIIEIINNEKKYFDDME